MIWAAGIKEVFIAQHAIDFRKGADGLIAECYAMELDPYEGDCVVFVHRTRRSVKVIGGNAMGVWVLLRRFEGGALKAMFPFLEDPSFVSATQGELALLLEGATCEVKAKATPWRKTPQGDNRREPVLLRRSHEQEIEQSQQAETVRTQRAARGFRQGTRVGEGSHVQS